MPDPGIDQTRGNRLRERAKLAVRGVLHRFDLELSKGPYPARLVRTLEAYGIDTVLDVGANVGQFAVMTRRAGFPGRIVSCEPLSGAYSELARRASGDAAWTPLNTAVGSAPGELEINVAANSYSSSVLPMTEAHLTGAPGSGYVAVEKVPVTTVAALCQEHRLDPARTLLKIDTQGYEAEVLAGAGDLVTGFGAVQLELSFVELYEGQVLFDETVARLRGWGYRIHAIEPGFSGPDGRLLQCDGLFVPDRND